MKTVCAALVMAASAYAENMVQHQQQYAYPEQRSDDNTVVESGDWYAVPAGQNPYQTQQPARNPFE